MPQSPTYTEIELIPLLKGKNQKAFNYLYDNYSGALLGIIQKILGVTDNGTDLLQEVFVKVWHHIESYDSTKGRLFTWMLNIARNTAIDYSRSKQFNNDKKVSALGDSTSMYALDNSMQKSTDHLGLSKVVNQLKAEHRIVIEMAYFKGYTQDEISKELNIPVGTVKTRTRNALIQLKNILK